nr:MAG TPA: hypothetical protein [Caudoviricetes sp.]
MHTLPPFTSRCYINKKQNATFVFFVIGKH